MTKLNHVARRATICASLAVVVAMAAAVPLKPAAAAGDWNSGQWRNHSNGQEHNDREWNRGGYGGGYGGGSYYRGQSYYYSPAPTYYYYQPQPYYQPRPYYSQPGASFTIVIP